MNEAPYRELVEQAPDATIFADPDGAIVLWNDRATALFGFSAEEARGRSLDLIIPEHLRPAHWRGYRQAISSGRTRLGERPILTRAVHKNGSKVYVELAFAVITRGDAVLGAVATARRASKPAPPI